MKIKNLLIITIIFLIGILVVNHNVYAEETTGEETKEEIKWTDTSKSEITLEENLGGAIKKVKFKINNIENAADSSDYAFMITSTSDKPSVNAEKFKNEFKSLSCDKEKKILTGDCTSYVELNQDLYLWVCQTDILKDEYKYIVEGKKLERNPLGINIFQYTFISYSSTQISFKVPCGEKTTRKVNVKVGKISDENILKNIKNNTNDSWKQLLSYAKQSKTIYNEKLTCDSAGSLLIRTGIDLEGLLEDKAYYYLYTEFDDENGKYYPVEGLTFGIADVYNELRDKPWFLRFYGDDKFQWILNEGDVEAENTSTKKVDDSTIVNKTKLPNTGAQITIIGIVAIITGFAIVFKFKYKKYKGIK